MRCLTVRQPYAWAIIHAGKNVENRTTNTVEKYFRECRNAGIPCIVAVHAGKTLDDGFFFWGRIPMLELSNELWGTPIEDALKAGERIQGSPGGLPVGTPPPTTLGAVIGAIEVVGVHESFECQDTPYPPAPPVSRYCSPWAIGDQWHIELANPVALPAPVPCRGNLGLWTLPEDVALAVNLQLTTMGHPLVEVDGLVRMLSTTRTRP